MVWPASQPKGICDWKVTDVTTTIMSSSRPPKKPPPPDLQRLGKPAPKGDGHDDYHHVVKQATKKATTTRSAKIGEACAERQRQGESPNAWDQKSSRRSLARCDLLGGWGASVWKQRLAEEAAEEYSRETADNRVKKEVWATARRADPSTEELNRFLSYHDNMNMDIDAEANSQSVEMSEASRPTSLWSASSEQFLRPPHDEGHSSGASSKASKRRRSPSPFGRSRESCTSSRGRRNPFEAGPPPGRYHQSSTDEENQLLREEVQRLRDYGREDQMRIHFLERQMATERQLGYTEGLAQAAQLQLRSPTTDREYGRGRPPGRDYDKDHARDLRHATEESRRMYRNESRGHSASGARPSRSGPSSSSRHHPSGPPPPEISKAGQREPPCQGPPPPNEMVIKTKTNGWAEPKSIRPERLACIPLLEGIKYTAMKMAVIPIIDPPQCPEEATSYANLWAGLARGITIPETFVRIFQVVGRLIDHSYYHNMALRYVIFRRIVVVNAHHLSRDALHGFLVTLAVFRHQVTNLPRIWEEILSRQSSNSDNDWTQARRFACHPSFRLPMFGLMFVPPDVATMPWGVRTQWSERELTGLLMVMRPSWEALQQLLHYADAFVRTRPASNPLHGVSIAGFTPEQMFSAPFVMAEPFLNGLVLSATAAPSSAAAAAPSSAAATSVTAATAATATSAPASASAPGPSEQRAPMEQDEGNTSTLTVKAQKPPPKH
jgi:hypothetical protein